MNPHDIPPEPDYAALFANPADPAAVKAHAVGYCPDMRPFAEWHAHGLCCAYEHCVECSPLTGGPAACPVFGHDCPGGVAVAEFCRFESDERDAWAAAVDAVCEDDPEAAAEMASWRPVTPQDLAELDGEEPCPPVAEAEAITRAAAEGER